MSWASWAELTSSAQDFSDQVQLSSTQLMKTLIRSSSAQQNVSSVKLSSAQRKIFKFSTLAGGRRVICVVAFWYIAVFESYIRVCCVTPWPVLVIIRVSTVVLTELCSPGSIFWLMRSVFRPMLTRQARNSFGSFSLVRRVFRPTSFRRSVVTVADVTVLESRVGVSRVAPRTFRVVVRISAEIVIRISRVIFWLFRVKYFTSKNLDLNPKILKLLKLKNASSIIRVSTVSSFKESMMYFSAIEVVRNAVRWDFEAVFFVKNLLVFF